MKIHAAMLGLLGTLGCASGHAQEQPRDIVETLEDTVVSRLEWGLEKYRQALVEHFRIDPISLEPSVPPFFINVIWRDAEQQILVEIGRTFGSTDELRAKELCASYLVQARSMLSVDRVGRPVVNGVSSLAADFFYPITTAGEPPPEYSKAVDELVILRGLVVAPLNGIYSVCTARLTNSPIRFVEQ